jgi:hypothetical protein
MTPLNWDFPFDSLPTNSVGRFRDFFIFFLLHGFASHLPCPMAWHQLFSNKLFPLPTNRALDWFFDVTGC